jgi:hypothetical protein
MSAPCNPVGFCCTETAAALFAVVTISALSSSAVDRVRRAHRKCLVRATCVFGYTRKRDLILRLHGCRVRRADKCGGVFVSDGRRYLRIATPDIQDLIASTVTEPLVTTASHQQEPSLPVRARDRSAVD